MLRFPWERKGIRFRLNQGNRRGVAGRFVWGKRVPVLVDMDLQVPTTLFLLNLLGVIHLARIIRSLLLTP